MVKAFRLFLTQLPFTYLDYGLIVIATDSFIDSNKNFFYDVTSVKLSNSEKYINQNCKVNMSTIAPVTRKVARLVLSTIKRYGHTRGVTLKKIHDYIKEEYPNSPYNIVRINNTLQKALAFGAVTKNKNNK